MSQVELNHRMMILDAILSIQAGDNPRVLAEKLESFVAPSERGKQKSDAESPSAELREAA
jgi:chemotaxis protein MotA